MRKFVRRASIAVAGTALAATAAALDPQQFVVGWPIEAPSDAEVFDIVLTPAIYEAAADGLEQLAVLDAAGEPQPFFRRGAAAPQEAEQRVVLEASPLQAGTTAAPNVGVTTNPRGTSVTVTPGSASQAITSFVIDARGLETVPRRLELEWRPLPQPFLLEVHVEQSTDLSAWRTVGRASIAALSIGGTEVRHVEVPVRANAGGYFRVTPGRAVADWHLLRATLVSLAAEPPQELDVHVAALGQSEAPDDGPANALYFDTGGILPAVSASLDFRGNDGWARTDIAASRTLAGPWLPVARGALFYELEFEEREFASTPVALGRREVRYWRVVPSAPLRAESVELAVRFPLEHLRVSARGRPPYLLAAGTLTEEAGPDATFASVWSQLDLAADAVPFASLGAERELGGAAALVAPRAVPWRSMALWAVLVAGVLVVATMAVRLARDMRNQPS